MRLHARLSCQVRTCNVRTSKDKEGKRRLKQQKRQMKMLSKRKKQLQLSISATKKEAAELRLQVRAFDQFPNVLFII